MVLTIPTYLFYLCAQKNFKKALKLHCIKVKLVIEREHTFWQMSFGPWWRYVKFREKWNFLSPRKLILKLRGKLWEFLGKNPEDVITRREYRDIFYFIFYAYTYTSSTISVCVFHWFAIYVRSWQSVSMRKRIRPGAIKFSGQRLFWSIRSGEHFQISAFHISHLHEFLGLFPKCSHLLHFFFDYFFVAVLSTIHNLKIEVFSLLK